MIYERIKQICKEKGISVASVEKAANVSNGLLSKWDSVFPRVDNLRSVAQVLGCSVEDLLKEPDPIEKGA